MNITYLFKYLWKKKWLILIPTVLAILAAWFFSRNQPKTYTSMAEIATGYMEINPLDNRAVNNTVLFNNVIQTLVSNQILDQVSYKLLLHDLAGSSSFKDVSAKATGLEVIKEFPGGKLALINFLHRKSDSMQVLNLSVKEDRIARKLADAYGYSPNDIIGQTQIKRIEGSDFINITATTTNPDLSAFMANGICSAFLAFYQNKQGQASASSLDTLRSIMETKKQLLDNKLKLLQSGEDVSASNSLGMLGSLQGLLTQQKNNLIAAQVELANVNQQLNVANKQGGLANNEDIITLRNNIDNLYAKYINDGSKDAELLEQINKLRNSLQQKLSTVGNSTGGVSVGDLMKQKMDLEVKINVAKQTMSDLQQKINSLTSLAQSSASKEGIVQSVQSEVEVARQDYANANKLYNEAINRNIFPGNNFRQTLIASPPLYPNPSEKLKIIGLAGTGVFFVLVFAFIFMEFIDPSIKSPSFLKENTPFPLLANLEKINLDERPVEDIFSSNGPLPLVKRSFREQIKQLRYEIENSGEKIFLVTSYRSRTGRTTLIKALAKGLSLNSRKILMIDANFQNNSLSKQYAITDTIEEVDTSKDGNVKMKQIISSTNDSNIDVIGCGSGNYTPDEVLPQKNIFTYLKSPEIEYDYVLIDCAASIQGPDCKELLKYVGGVILLYAADQSLSEEDKKFAEFLRRYDVNVAGVVLNKVNSYYMNV